MAGNKKTPSAKYAFIGLILAVTRLCVHSFGWRGKRHDCHQNVHLRTALPGLTLPCRSALPCLSLDWLAYAIMAPETVRRFFTGRQARYGSNSLILALAFVGIIFVVNYIVFQNPKSWDMTADKSNTLAPETLQALATLPEKVTATAFYTASLNSASADELLLKFKTNSGGKFDYRFVDPDLDPLAAREAGITGDGKIMLQMGDRKEIASFANETELTKTLIRLISPQARVVYFLEGHGEPTLDSKRAGQFFHRQKHTRIEELHGQFVEPAFHKQDP